MTKEPSLRSKLILFPLAAIFFVLVCTFVVLSALGYNLKFINGKLITEKVGMILISTKPGDAKVYIDGKLNKNKTPIFNLGFMPLAIDKLKLGEHTIKIEKEGYENWEGVFVVHPGIVTWGNYIILVSQKRTASPYNINGKITQTLSSLDKSRLLVFSENIETGLNTVYSINTQTKEKTKVFEERIEQGLTVSIVGVSNDGTKMLIQKNRDQAKNLYVYEVKDSPRSWNLTDIIKNDFTSVIFYPQNQDQLIMHRAGALYNVDFVTGKISVAIASNVVGIYNDTNNLLYIQNNQNDYELWRLDQTNAKSLIATKIPVTDSYQIHYLSQLDIYAILDVKNKILYKKNGDHYDSQYTVVAEKVDWFSASANSLFLSYFKEGTLYSLDAENGKTFETLKGKVINSISWFPDEKNLLYVSEDKLYIVNYNGYYDKFLFTANKDFPAVVAPNADNIFFSALNTDLKQIDLYSFTFS